MSHRKKNKFVPISNVKDPNTFLMPGRHKCDCAATKHELINNCTNCGRIVCAQEGSGQCWYCGELVCTNDELQHIASKSNKSQKVLEKLLQNKWSHQNIVEDFDKISEKILNKSNDCDNKMADERKQRLLEFDKTSARRTKVIDDEKDYYTTEGKVWMNPKKREILKQKENELREKRFAPKHSRPLVYSLDLKHGKLIEEAPSNDAAYELFEDPEFDQTIPNNYQIETMPNIDTGFLSFIGENRTNKNVIGGNSNEKKVTRRLQDQEIQEIRDEGMCMSMHQPWASLLVSGAKRHEGRSWYTAHRGILWIAATVKVPTPESIRECEMFYTDRGVNTGLLPHSYPTGCLLGCVNVTDCMPEDEYAERYPDGESGSPFVFLCEDPRQLNFKFPVKGRHKIYKLDRHVHVAAKAAVQRIQKR